MHMMPKHVFWPVIDCSSLWAITSYTRSRCWIRARLTIVPIVPLKGPRRQGPQLTANFSPRCFNV